MTSCPRCREMRDRLTTAEERVKQLLDALGTTSRVPAALGLSSGDTAILGVILRQPVATFEALSLACELTPGSLGQAPSLNSITTRICYLRTRLKPFGITIENRRGEGYVMSDAGKRRLREMIAAETVPETTAA